MSKAAGAARRAALAGRDAHGSVADPATGKGFTMTETRRVELALNAVADRAAVPDRCGDAIPLAPARGPVEAFEPGQMVPDGRGGHRLEHNGWRGRSGARVGDVFDRMVDQARRAHAGRGRKAGAFRSPFSWGQVQIGRDYAALTERCNAAGARCSSLEAQTRAGTGGGVEEAVLADFQRLRALHRRIGPGLAKELRRHRPVDSSAGPDPRKAITARHLVDQVCLAGKTPDEILREAGWAVNAKIRRDLRDALCAALDRMQGYGLARPQDMA